MRLIDLRAGLVPALVLTGGLVLAACSTTQPTTAPSPEPTAAPSAAPSEAPSVEPSVEPSPEPTASPPTAGEPTRIDVPLTIFTSHTVTARVVDWTGLVTGATSGTPGDGASVPFDEIRIANAGDSALDVTWAGGPCDQTVSVVLDGPKLTVVQEPCQGDSVAFDRIVRLQLNAPTQASSIQGVMQLGGDTPAS